MSYKPSYPPRDYQKSALQKMGSRPAFALLMAMRTGKTKVLLDNYGTLELNGEVGDLLVVAPAGVYKTWKVAMEEHLSVDLAKRLRIHVWEGGKTAGERKALERFIADAKNPRALLVNVEALSAVERARDLCEKFLSQRKAMLVVDESTIIKNPSAKRTRFVWKLGELASHRRILSGLPTPRSPLDLYGQFYFLDPKILGFRSYYGFRARYAIMKNIPMGPRNVPIVVGYRDIDELQQAIAPHSFRVPFRPKIPSTYSIREVKLTKEQQRIYAEIRDNATSELSKGKHVTATAVITQIIRMHQVLCGHTRTENGEYVEIPETRTSELLELLEDYAGKAIIWCSYDADVRKVAAALDKEYGQGSAARFWGGNVKTRESEEKLFKEQAKCRWMVATPDAGKFGRTWTNADLVVYYSSTNDLEKREQSEQRPLGVDKDRQVDYIDLMVPGTVETKIINALRKKIDMSTVINGDNFREWLI